MKTKIQLLIIFSLALVIYACKKDNIDATVTDIDGNEYHTVKIGTQVWMKENLKVSRYRNGDPIPNVSNGTDWSILTTGANCDYEDSPDSSSIYGKIYNWYAVNDSRNMAPAGWHVATDAEWTTLTDYLGGQAIAGDKMKATTLWTVYPGIVNTNSSGFTALPAGGRGSNGLFYGIRITVSFWSSTEHNVSEAEYRNLDYNLSNVVKSYATKGEGYYVRCVKD